MCVWYSYMLLKSVTNQWLQLSLDCFIATLLKLNATITEKSPPHIMKGVLVYTEVKLDSRLL